MEDNSIVYWMRLALEQAAAAETLDEVPIGAVIVSENEIIGCGHNLRETLNRTASHAEMMALEQFNQKSSQWRLPPDSALFVTTEPCLMCAGALLEARIGKIFYGCHDPKEAGIRAIVPLIEKGIFDHKPTQIMGGILETESSNLLSRFFQKKRQGKS